MRFTIFGASGFIGSRLLANLRQQKHECITPTRDSIPEMQDLGYVFYCIGLTADFRTQLLATINAHVCHLLKILSRCCFKRICYLSSTRIYQGMPLGDETSSLLVRSDTESDVYNLSKLMGEAACLTAKADSIVVRLSNVFSQDDQSNNFLPSIIREVRTTGRLKLNSTLDSAKDYVSLEDVLKMLPQIIVHGRNKIYNLASGQLITHAEIASCLGCPVEVTPRAPQTISPPISIERLRREFSYIPRDIRADIAAIGSSLKDRT